MTPQEKLAQALEELKALQDAGKIAIHTDEISNDKVRQRLVKTGFLEEVTKGWYIPADPGAVAGDTTSWYASYWEFCAGYLKQKFDDDYCLSPEQSLCLLTGNRNVPAQLIVRSPRASNSSTSLLNNASIFNYSKELPPADMLTEQYGLRTYTLPAALINCPPAFFNQAPIEARAALAMIRDASELLPFLLNNGNTRIAGRLAGAFRNIGKDRIADEIVASMRAAEYDVREDDPFASRVDFDFRRAVSPYVTRIKLLWQGMRKVVMEVFPPAPGMPQDVNAFMQSVEDVYVTDAYHSLSIERYKVSPELIERVRSGKWDINADEDKGHRDAMAARGYYLTFQEVKNSILQIFAGKNSGHVLDANHSRWYRALFEPSVSAGLLKPSDLAGYRNQPIYIRGAKHVPPGVDAMRDLMPVLFELLEEEPEASVRAVLGHFIFVFIHPYADGNGRMGRFLMNTMLTSGGYPWMVIPVERRQDYMKALEAASSGNDILPFATFIADLVQKSMDGKPEANLDHARHDQ